MSPVRVPHRSGPHRVAAVALFRALITQSRAIALPDEQRTGLLNVVRNRFKQWRHVTSARQLRLAFDAGYEAIDYLDSAVAGVETSRRHIAALLERAPERIKQPLQWTSWVEKVKQEREATRQAAREAANVEVRPKVSVLDRPLPSDQLTGRRHVPKLVNANGFPFLRFKKPQPKSLSGYLNKQDRYRAKAHTDRFRLYEGIQIAGFEDGWDALMRELTKKEQLPPSPSADDASMPDSASGIRSDVSNMREPSWKSEAEHAIQVPFRYLHRRRAKVMDIAHKMHRVVEREQALRDQEDSQRKEARRQRYLAQKSD